MKGKLRIAAPPPISLGAPTGQALLWAPSPGLGLCSEGSPVPGLGGAGPPGAPQPRTASRQNQELVLLRLGPGALCKQAGKPEAPSPAVWGQGGMVAQQGVGSGSSPEAFVGTRCLFVGRGVLRPPRALAGLPVVGLMQWPWSSAVKEYSNYSPIPGI